MRAGGRGGAAALLLPLLIVLTHLQTAAADEDTLELAVGEDIRERGSVRTKADEMKQNSPLSQPPSFEYFSVLRRNWGRAVSVLPKTTRVGWIGGSDLGMSFVRAIAKAGYNVTVADRCFVAPEGGQPKMFCGTRTPQASLYPPRQRAQDCAALTPVPN